MQLVVVEQVAAAHPRLEPLHPVAEQPVALDERVVRRPLPQHEGVADEHPPGRRRGRCGRTARCGR